MATRAITSSHRRNRSLRIAERLGFGIHGIIFATEGNLETGDIATAIKVLFTFEPKKHPRKARPTKRTPEK